MHNMKFIDIVKLVYKVSGLVVIGIDVIVDDYKPIVCLNPSNYLIAPFDTYFLISFKFFSFNSIILFNSFIWNFIFPF